MKLLKFIFIFSFFLGCVSSQPIEAVAICDDESILFSNTSLFDVLEVNGSVNIHKTNTEDVLDSDFILEFSACIVDRTRASGTKITNSQFDIFTFQTPDQIFEPDDSDEITYADSKYESFSIPGDSKNRRYMLFKAVTDFNGCLNWTESYKFTIPTNNQWVYFERVIENASGRVIIPLSVNPWLRSTEDGYQVKIHDLRYNQWANTGSFKPFKLDKQVKKSSNIDQCVQRRSLTEIFKHIEKGPSENMPLLWADSVDLKSLYVNVSKPPAPNHSDVSKWTQAQKDYYDKYNICYGKNEKNSQSNEVSKTCDQLGSFLSLELRVPIKTITTNHLKEIEKRSIDHGVFEVTPYLVARKSKNNYYRLHRPLKPIEVTVDSESKDLQIPEFLVHTPFDSGVGIELMLKIQEKKQDKQTQPFYGIFNVAGETNSVHSQSRTITLKSLPFSLEPRNLISRVLNVSKDDFKKQLQKVHAYQEIFDKKHLLANERDGFYRSKLALDLKRMRYVRVHASPLAQCESVVKRTVVYVGEVCLKDPRRKIEFNKQKITVTAEDIGIEWDPDKERVILSEGSQKRVNMIDGESYCNGKQILNQSDRERCFEDVLVDSEYSDNPGCIQFIYELEHKPYDRQQYYAKKFKFFSDEYGYWDEKIVAFNPWEFGFLTFQDITQFYSRLRSLKSNQSIQDQMTAQNKTLNVAENTEVNKSSFKADGDFLALLSSAQVKDPIIRLNEYRSILIEPSYLIDSTLDVSIVKNIMLLIQPKIYRTDPIGQTIRAEPLVFPKGHWLLRVIFAKGPQEKKGAKENIVQPHTSVQDDLMNIFNPLHNGFIKSFTNFFKFNQCHRSVRDRSIENPFEHYSGCLQDSSIESFITSPSHSPIFKEDDYISHFDTVAYSENGVISAYIHQQFDVGQFRYLGSKNSILFEIYPTDPEKYVYKIDENGFPTCDLDVKNSKFIPYKDHDLITPTHWGVFQSNEFGNWNIVQPLKNSEEALNVFSSQTRGSIGDALDTSYFYDDALALNNSVKHLEDYHKDSSMAGKYQTLLENVYSDIQKDRQYCSGVDFSSWSAEDINNTSIESEWFKKCVCSQDDSLKDAVHECLLKQDFSQVYKTIVSKSRNPKKPVINPNVVDRILENQKTSQNLLSTSSQHTLSMLEKKSFCKNRNLKSKVKSLGYSGQLDYSNNGENYINCICNDSSEDSLSTTISKCFAKTNALSYHDVSSDFVNDLNDVQKQPLTISLHDNIDETSVQYAPYKSIEDTNLIENFNDTYLKFKKLEKQDILNVIQNGFSTQNIRNPSESSFLHLMCYFWFDKYYEKYLSTQDLEDFYNSQISSFKYLERKIAVDPGTREVDFLDELSSLSGQTRQKIQNFLMTQNHKKISQPFNDITSSVRNHHPYNRCMKNPLYFFHIERKVMVGHLSDQPSDFVYNNGHVYTFNVSATEDKNARLDWTFRNALATKIGPGLRFSLANLASRLTSLRQFVDMNASIDANIGFERNRSESETVVNARRTTEGITLAMNHVNMDITFNRYKKCLLIRPKGGVFGNYESAWNSDIKQEGWFEIFKSDEDEDDGSQSSFIRWPYETMGLLLCDEEKDSITNSSDQNLTVSEDYYYMHQFFGGHSYEFMSRTIYHNRPYVAILRGKKDVDQLLYFINAQLHPNQVNVDRDNVEDYTRSSQPQNLFYVEDNVPYNVRQAFINTRLDWSGFTEGVYTYNDPNTHYLSNLEHLVGEKSSGRNLIGSTADNTLNRISNELPEDSCTSWLGKIICSILNSAGNWLNDKPHKE